MIEQWVAKGRTKHSSPREEREEREGGEGNGINRSTEGDMVSSKSYELEEEEEEEEEGMSWTSILSVREWNHPFYLT